MPTQQTDWIVPLLSAGGGAVMGALITVLSEWALTSIKKSTRQRRDREAQQGAWRKKLRLVVHRFDLLWTPWVAGDHPNYDEPRPWVTELFEESLVLRSDLGPCAARSQMDEATRELGRIQQLEMEYQGQAADAYEDFVSSCNAQLELLKNLADSSSGEMSMSP